MENKKAISPVITTILLILISVTAVAFVASVVNPFIKEQLIRTRCFNAAKQIDIDTTSKYTCWEEKSASDDNIAVAVNVRRKSEALGMKKFVITVYGEGRSEKFEITEGNTPANVFMYKVNAAWNGGSVYKEVPKVGETKTYVLGTGFKKVDSVTIAPSIEDGTVMCDEGIKNSISDEYSECATDVFT
jgi:flagellin-like protein